MCSYMYQKTIIGSLFACTMVSVLLYPTLVAILNEFVVFGLIFLLWVSFVAGIVKLLADWYIEQYSSRFYDEIQRLDKESET